MGNLQTVVCEFQQLFQTCPGKTDASYHYILTIGPPVHVPPRHIPMHYRDEVLRVCWIRELSSKAIAYEWPLQFLCEKSDCVLITELSTREHHGMHTHSRYLTKYKICWLSQPFFQLWINDVGSSNFLVPLEDQEKTGFCPR